LGVLREISRPLPSFAGEASSSDDLVGASPPSLEALLSSFKDTPADSLPVSFLRSDHFSTEEASFEEGMFFSYQNLPPRLRTLLFF